MYSVGKVLRKVLPWRREGTGVRQDPQKLRAMFRARYHSFKLLLTANSRALEIMSEMERAARGDRAFGMSFVKAKVTGVCVNVFRMIKHLDELAPGKYRALFDRFHEIQEKINREIAPHGVPLADQLTYPLEKVTREMADLVGSKMANLGEVRRINLKVPPGFVITTLAYKRFMESGDLQDEIEKRLQATELEDVAALHGLSASIQQLIMKTPLPEDVAEAILEAYRELEEKAGPRVAVSMRSSALAEDV